MHWNVMQCLLGTQWLSMTEQQHALLALYLHFKACLRYLLPCHFEKQDNHAKMAFVGRWAMKSYREFWMR